MATTKKDEPLDLLREPFDNDQIEEVDGFRNVEPRHYLQRLIDTGEDYSIERGTPVVIKHGDASAVAIVTKVTFVGNVYADVGAKPLDDSDESKQLAYKVKAAASDSIKRALLGAGLGLELYNDDDEPEEEKKPARSSRRSTKSNDDDEDDDSEDAKPKRGSSKPARGSRGKWDGSEEVGFGSHKGEAYSDVDGSWLAYVSDTFDDGPNKTKIEKEIARREADGTYDPEEGNDKKKSAAKKSSRNSGSKNTTGKKF